MWFKLNNQKGYLLLEMQVCLLVIAVLIGTLVLNFRQVLYSWQNMMLDTQLNAAGRYMQSFLEKEIGHQGQKIVIKSIVPLETEKIVVQGIKHSTYYTYYWKRNKKGLYKKTETNETQGINPLYLPDCPVTAWHAEKVTDDALVVSFTLSKDGRYKKFTQLILCVNGEVYMDE